MSRYLAVVLLLLAPVGNAWSLPVSALPGQLQACIGDRSCIVDASAPVFATGAMEAYLFADNLGGVPAIGYALRYSLLPPSGVYDFNTLAAPYAGDVWLTVFDSYNLAADSNRVTVYTDMVVPQPGNLLNDSNGLDIDIDLTNAALLSGAGFVSSGLNVDNQIDTQGNIDPQSDFGGSALFFCLAEGCGTSITLNLLYLAFQDQGDGTAALTFNPDDPRSLLYQVISDYNEVPENGGFSIRQSYYVAPVPLPATAWLMLSGLAVLGARLRRVRG